jgi:hypothetical protein
MPITPHIVVQCAERAASFVATLRRNRDRADPDARRTADVDASTCRRRAPAVADEFPELGVLAPPSVGGTPVVLSLEVADADAAFARAIAAGATVSQPLAAMFWCDRHGQLEDPFGHRVNVSQHVRDVLHDEVVGAAARLFS